MDDEIVDNQDGSVSILRHMRNVQITKTEFKEEPHRQRLNDEVPNPYSEWFNKQRMDREREWREK